jgi:hypothetical protein
MGATESSSDAPVFAAASADGPGRDASLKSAAYQNKKNLENVVIYKQNPNACTIILGMLVLWFVVYWLWIFTLSSSPEGWWIDTTTNNSYLIDHGRVWGSLTIQSEGIEPLMGSLYNSVLVFGEDPNNRDIGVWNGNEIFWNNNKGEVKTWKREIQLVPV